MFLWTLTFRKKMTVTLSWSKRVSHWVIISESRCSWNVVCSPINNFFDSFPGNLFESYTACATSKSSQMNIRSSSQQNFWGICCGLIYMRGNWGGSLELIITTLKGLGMLLSIPTLKMSFGGTGAHTMMSTEHNQSLYLWIRKRSKKYTSITFSFVGQLENILWS